MEIVGALGETQVDITRGWRIDGGSQLHARDSQGARLRRLGCFVVIAVLAAGCATPAAHQPTANDRTDVWFTQHMVPYLRQTTTVVSLTRPYLTDPTLARLADKVNRTSQADIQQLQGWLDQRGLSPHIHSHQRIDTRRQTDLERLSQLRGSALDLAFVRVMTARARAGINLTATEVSDGGLPEVRQLAHQMLAEQQAQSRQFKRLSHTAKARTSHPPAKAPAQDKF
jgi:uncharacterized protein (DUF305 family)